MSFVKFFLIFIFSVGFFSNPSDFIEDGDSENSCLLDSLSSGIVGVTNWGQPFSVNNELALDFEGFLNEDLILDIDVFQPNFHSVAIFFFVDNRENWYYFYILFDELNPENLYILSFNSFERLDEENLVNPCAIYEIDYEAFTDYLYIIAQENGVDLDGGEDES